MSGGPPNPGSAPDSGSAPGPPRPHSLIADLVGRLLDYMSSPWRAAVITLLAILGGIGWGLWAERGRILDRYAPRSATMGRPALVKADVAPQLEALIGESGADIAALWAVDLANNAAQFVQGRQKGGGAWNFRPARTPAIVDRSDPKALARILDGHSVCLDLTAAVHGAVTEGFAAAGMAWLCLVPVPPSQTAALLAVVCIAWRTRPPPALEAAALHAAATDADQMVTH